MSGVEATAERLKALKSNGALHIAAPFRVNSASPLFSPILLAQAAEGAPPVRAENEAGAVSKEAPTSPPTDAGLETREVFNMDVAGSAVMFSDPAALAKRDAAAAAGIVRWAWRAAGTTTVIFKRWGGDDQAAADVIDHYYRELRAGKSAPGALDAARAAVRRTEEGRAPAAWAGWLILTGR